MFKKTLAVVINIYSNWLQQNGELIFDISLETSYDNISMKLSEYPDTSAALIGSVIMVGQ